MLCEAAWAHTCTQKLVWVAVAGWQLSWAEVKAWGPVTERTEGSSIIIKNDTSAPYCSLTASSSQAVRLFVRLLCQCGWSVFLNQCTFQSEKRFCYLMGRKWAEDKKVALTRRWDHHLFFIFWISIQISNPYYLRHIHLSLRLKNSFSQLFYYVTLQGIELSRHVFLPVSQLWFVPVGTGTHDASVVHKKTDHCGEVCLILLWE